MLSMLCLQRKQPSRRGHQNPGEPFPASHQIGAAARRGMGTTAGSLAGPTASRCGRTMKAIIMPGAQPCLRSVLAAVKPRQVETNKEMK